MQKILFLLALLFFSHSSNCQDSKSVEVECKFKSNTLSNYEDFIFSITIVNKEQAPVYISKRPTLSSTIGNFGDIQVRVERLQDSCYRIIDIDENPIGIDFFGHTRELAFSESAIHNVDIRNFGFIKKGTYRVKVYYTYVIKGKKEISESGWYFFQVSKYEPKKNVNLFREE